MKSPAELIDAFRANGKKVTPQRERIFHILHQSQEHPSADVVFAQLSAEMPTVSLKTVYQVLGELVEMGEIHVLDLGLGAMRFDPNSHTHHHLVCVICNGVEDVDVALPDVAKQVGDLSEFLIESIELTLRGRCSNCQGQVLDSSR